MSDSRRILLISHELSVTGAPNSLLRQAKYFRDAGFAVDVWTYAMGDLLPRYEEAGFHPEPVADNKRSIEAKYEANPVRYELVVCNTIRTYRSVDVLRRRRLRVAWFIRETKLLDEDYWMKPEFAALFRRYYNLYTVSEYAAQVVRQYNHRVRVIHNAIEDRFRVLTPPLSGRVRFGYIGSFIPAKGLDLLVTAYRRMCAKFPGCELHIAGGVPQPAAERLQRETADEKSILWLGEVQGSAKESFFAGIDVLCVPSMDEPAGLTVIEGAMYGKAIVTTDHTGANYLVDPSSGRIVPAGDAESLAAAMTEIASLDTSALAAMSQHSRELYLKYGTIDEERKAVLRMVTESSRAPRVWWPILYDDESAWLHETHYEDGRRRFYLKNLRLFTLQGRGVIRR